MSANSKQVGGSHYKPGSNVQHWDFVAQNDLSYLVGCTTKYLVRHREKSGRQDLEKALHYIEKLRELYDRAQILVPCLSEHDLPISVETFCEANAVTGSEARAVRLLTLWESRDELDEAWMIVSDLIQQQG